MIILLISLHVIILNLLVGEIMFYLYALIVSLFLSGCASNGFSEYYTPYAQDKVAPTDQLTGNHSNENERLQET